MAEIRVIGVIRRGPLEKRFEMNPHDRDDGEHGRWRPDLLVDHGTKQVAPPPPGMLATDEEREELDAAWLLYAAENGGQL